MEAATSKILYITAGIALSYALFAQVGFLVSLLPYHNITLFWPPSGIALAAVLLFGTRALPGIALGALITNVSQHLSDPLLSMLGAATMITVASTLSPWVAGEALKRILPGAPNSVSATELLRGSIVLALVCAVTASVGIVALYITGLIPAGLLSTGWGIWWLGDFCGMIIFGPSIWFLAHFAMRYRSNKHSGSMFVAGLVVSAFGATALLVFAALWNVETIRMSRSLENESSLAAKALVRSLNEARHTMVSIRALVYSTESLEEDEFRRYIAAHFSEQSVDSGMQAVGWAPRVTDALRWETDMHNVGQTLVRLYENDTSGQRMPVKPRQDYFPVQFIQPLNEANQRAIGFDLGSEKMRGAALERARDSGRAAMVAPIILVQSAEAEPAMLICVAIYQPDIILDTVESRRANLTGFASGVYLLRELFDAAMGSSAVDVDLHFFEDSPATGALWYHSRVSPARVGLESPRPGVTLESLQAGAHGSARLEFSGHHWVVVATPRPALIQKYRTWVPWAGLLSLVAFGLVLGGVLSERISARKSVEDERQKTLQALRDAQAANDSKSYFMAAAAHDIKQPLYALGMLVDTLVMSDSRAATMPIVQNLKQGVAQMSEHFDSLMDVGKFHDGNFEVTRSLFQLGDFSARIDIEIAPLCESKGLRWYLDMADVWVFTDEELLLRLFRNLLTNAVTYTVAGEISCSARVKDGVVWFSISDTGVGIAEELQVAVFEKFVRLEKSGIGTAGLGLGLSIVEKINKALDLDLKMNSTPGMGTRFTFRLPKVH